MRKILELHIFLKIASDERLLVSKKVTLVVSPNVKVWSDVILISPNVTIKLLSVRKIEYHRM